MKKWRIIASIISLLLIVCFYRLFFLIGNTSHRRTEILYKLRQTTLALRNYYDFHNRYPNSTIVENGKVIGSWRYKLLPYLQSFNQSEIPKCPWENSIYKDIHFDMFCLTDQNNDAGLPATNILAVTGNGTIYDSAKVDYSSRLILLVAVDKTNIAWGEPGDLEIDGNGNVIGRFPPPIDGKWYGISFADGQAWLLNDEVPLKDLKLFFTLNTAINNNPDDLLGPYCIAKYPE
jgi:hypothetical protein